MGAETTNLKFIDCYSKYTGQFDPERATRDIVVDSPSLLNDISLAINDAISEGKGKKVNFIFHTISGFLLYNKASSLIKFLQLNLGKLKHAGAVVFLVVDKSTEEKDLDTFLEYSSDHVLSLSMNEGKGTMKVDDIPYLLPIKSSFFGVELV